MGSTVSNLAMSHEETKVQLSDDCLNLLNKKPIEKPRPPPDKKPKKKSVEYDVMMGKKLRCSDDNHTIEKGLTEQNIDFLVENIDQQLHIPLDRSNQEEVIRCLKQNKTCSIKCWRIMQNYIDMVTKQQIILYDQKFSFIEDGNEEKKVEIIEEENYNDE